MKIAIITSRYPSAGNPYSHMFVHMRSKEFIKQGEVVDVFVPCKEKKEYVFEGIRVKAMPSKEITNYLQDYDILYLHLLHIYPFMKTDGWPIYKAIMKRKYPFAIYVHGSEAVSFQDRFFGNQFGIKEFLSFLRKNFYQIPKLKRFFNSINMVNNVIITPSKWMRNQIVKTFKVKNIAVIPNGIDVDLFSYRNINVGKKLISIRPLGDKVYDIESTFHVMSLLPEEFSLDIYGEGKYRQEYERIIIEQGFSKRIKIIPNFIERNRMNHLFHKYQIFISTSKLDTQGVTMLEAMSSGLLVAAINNTSKEEFIIDMKTGVLGYNTAELADKILKVTSDSVLFNTITSSGRKSMEDIDIKVISKNELEKLNECI
jgi:glycosyltransferase involved in cell wall biosynthesis